MTGIREDLQKKEKSASIGKSSVTRGARVADDIESRSGTRQTVKAESIHSKNRRHGTFTEAPPGEGSEK